jgi:predicted ArsR family transcriptional regulator
VQTARVSDDAADPADPLGAIASLGEPTRRALYDYVVATGDWVSRDQAADAVGLERGTAAHHLDRLAADELLEIDYRRLSGRQGPGAGRPAKLYRRAGRDFEVSLPPRRYELAGSLLADAVDRSRSEGVDIAAAVDEVATVEGRRLADEIRGRVSGRSAAARRRALLEVLADHGYEPRVDEHGAVVLANCPFHELARQHTDLICNLNLSVLRAAVDEVGGTGLDPSLEPEVGSCCVRLRVL